MSLLRHLAGFAGAVLLTAPFASAEALPEAALAADVVFLGEVHDNPDHHARQAAWVATLQPEALVFEMITPESAAAAVPDVRRSAEALEAALAWEASGWPDFDMYYPIFSAASKAHILGAALPRDMLRGVVEGAFSTALPEAVVQRFNLEDPLPADQQEKREELQAQAHCDALPEEMLPGMVRVQRARDARLAAAAIEALDMGLRPVVVITGNGHARRDWGAPAALAAAVPGISVFSLGQGEEGDAPSGGFDEVADATAVPRGDPCEAFR